MDGADWLPFRLSLETGLRIGDVLTLKRGDVVKKDDVYIVRYKAQKTGKRGEAPISDPLGEALCKSVRDKKAFLFPSYGKSGHLTRQCAWERMKRAARNAGVDLAGVSPHSLRKCFAVELRREKGLAAVQEALQHSNDAITALYAYADGVTRGAPDEPIRWRDVDMLLDFLAERIKNRLDKAEKGPYNGGT